MGKQIPCSQKGRNPKRIPVDVEDLEFTDISGVISDAQHGTKTTIPSSHHVKTGDDEVYGLILTGDGLLLPPAGILDRFYWATGTLILYRDTGAAWVETARGETATRLAQLSEKLHQSLIGVFPDQHHNRFHDHSMAKDGSPIAVAGVPDLPASKTTSGAFNLARIPTIPHTKTDFANQALLTTSSPIFNDLRSIGQMHFDAAVEDKLSLYDARLGQIDMYGFGVEGNTLYLKSPFIMRWYIHANADDGVSNKLELNSTVFKAAVQIQGDAAGVVVKAKAGAHSDEDYTVDKDGLVGVDTRSGVEKIYFRAGGSWFFINKSGGITFPERKCAKCNKTFKVGDVIAFIIDKELPDGQFHAVPIHLKEQR